MCGIINKAEARGEFNILYKQIKDGMLTVYQAAKYIDKSVQELLDGFNKYNLVLWYEKSWLKSITLTLFIRKNLFILLL